MKDRIRTNSIRNIRKSFPRFLALLIMSALGVFTFIGLTATGPDMVSTLDRYLDEHNNYDIKIISDMGLDPEDVDAVKKLEGVKNAEGIYSRDVIAYIGKSEMVVNISSPPDDINKIDVLSGHFPEKKNEIAVEENLLRFFNMKHGDTFTIMDEGFHEKEVTITGTVKSPLFFNNVEVDPHRGVTNIGSGTIHFYAYAPKENFDQDYLTNIYVTVDGAIDQTTASDNYEARVKDVRNRIETIKEERGESRLKNIREKARSEIESKAQESQAKLDEADAQLKEAKKKLEDARKQLDDGKEQLEKNGKELDNAKLQLEDAKSKLEEKEIEYEEGKKLIADAGAELAGKETELAAARDMLEQARITIDEKQHELDKAAGQLADAKRTIDEKDAEAETAKKLIADGEKTLNDKQKELDEAGAALESAKVQLEEKKKQAAEAKELLDEGKKELDERQSQFDEALLMVESLKKEYDSIMDPEKFPEEVIEREKERLANIIAVVRKFLMQIADGIRDGSITIEKAVELFKEAIESYVRVPTVIERIIFLRLALDEMEPAIEEGRKALQEGWDKYNKGLAEYEEGMKQLDEAQKQYDDGMRQYNEGVDALKQAWAQLDEKKDELNEGLKLLEKGKRDYQDSLRQFNDGKALFDSAKAEYEKNRLLFSDGEAKFSLAKSEYESGLKMLQDGGTAIEDARKLYEDGLSQYTQGRELFEKATGELKKGEEEYLDGLRKYRSGLAEYEAGKANFDDEIEKAQSTLDGLNLPRWYVEDRMSYTTYSDYIGDARSIMNLSKVFPVVFILVAVMVSLISMNRMVEFDRLEIGTLKSLGFSRERILTKYASFALLATSIGGAVGAVLGLIILPSLIINIYKILFEIPKIHLGLNPLTTFLGYFLVILIVSGSGLLTAVLVMREKPAFLFRPKAPKLGKSILLEKIPGIWKKIRFSDKITIRNIFRYKRRVIVTICGIIGCTALMLAGFGLKDAIVDIPAMQFERVMKFDATVYVNGLNDTPEDNKKLDSLFDQKEINKYTDTMRINGELDGSEISVYVARDNKSISGVIKLNDYKTKKPLELKTGEVVITDKLASVKNIKVGDSITFTDLDKNDFTYKVSGITENYFDHIIYMNENTYEKNQHGLEYKPNMIFLQLSDIDDTQKEKLSERILSNENALNLTYKETLIKNADNMLKSLDKVVVILIVLSAVLSFVVLFNLSNININERKRELATLKVLGFYEREVDGYITKENVIITIVGIAAGLLLGILLTRVVVSTVEIEKARFINVIKPLSFIISAAMASLFTLIVNRITHLNLKRINMIDSLKSVE